MKTVVVDEKAEENMTWLGNSLREMRTEKGLTLEEVASGTGISINTLNKFELTGEGKTTYLMRIVRFLDRLEALESLRNVTSRFDPLDLVKLTAKKYGGKDA